MNDTIAGTKVTGEIRLDGEDIHAREQDPVLLRARVGMVFQKPNPFKVDWWHVRGELCLEIYLASNRSELDEFWTWRSRFI